MSHRFISSWVLILSLSLPVGCSRNEDADAPGATTVRAPRGDAEVMNAIEIAARALAEPDPSVDYVASRMEGVIKARTSAQALMHFDGYRVTMTTPSTRVTRITFVLVDRQPTIAQLTKAFGTPEEVRRGMLYHHHVEATGSTLRVLAEPVDKPVSETSLVRKVLIEGAITR